MKLRISALTDAALQGFLQELDSLNGDFVTGGFHAPPDGGGTGDDFDVGGEGFDDNVTFVFDGLESGGDRFPIDVIISRSAAITAASMEMCEVPAGFANGFALVLLFNVHVERIQVQFKRGAANVLDHLQALIAGV